MERNRTQLLNSLVTLFLLAFVAAAHAQAKESVTYYYTDPQGTVLATTDAAGNVTSTADFRPYGEQALGTRSTGPGYTGHLDDVDTGLLYMQARYFDPQVGRFLSTDPVFPSAGSMPGFNRYAYASNNPVTFIDPDGRQNMYAFGASVTEAQMLQSGNPVAIQHVTEANAGQARVVLAAAAVTVASPAAGFVARTAATVAADSLASGSLTTAIVGNASEITTSGVIVAEALAAASGSPSPVSPEMSAVGAEVQLTQGQASNLQRFSQKLPSANTGVYVDKLGKGVVFTATVPGRVPGSSAVYQKAVGEGGATTGYLKTTFTPDGGVAHIKDKYNVN